jgi:hypothetical protein
MNNEAIINKLMVCVLNLSGWRWNSAHVIGELFGKMVKELKEEFKEKDIFDPLGCNAFDSIVLPAGAPARFPTDFYGDALTALVLPNAGRPPEKCIDGDEITVPPYDIPNNVDWGMDSVRDNRIDWLKKALEVYLDGFRKRIGDDQIRILTAAGMSGETEPFDWHNHGTLAHKFRKKCCGTKISDLLVEPECMADIRHMLTGDTEVLPIKQIIVGDVRIHEVDNVSRFIANYTGTVTSEPICIALDLMNRDSFVQTGHEDCAVFNPTADAKRQGICGKITIGMAALNSNRALVVKQPEKVSKDLFNFQKEKFLSYFTFEEIEKAREKEREKAETSTEWFQRMMRI